MEFFCYVNAVDVNKLGVVFPSKCDHFPRAMLITPEIPKGGRVFNPPRSFAQVHGFSPPSRILQKYLPAKSSRYLQLPRISATSFGQLALSPLPARCFNTYCVSVVFAAVSGQTKISTRRKAHSLSSQSRPANPLRHPSKVKAQNLCNHGGDINAQKRDRSSLPYRPSCHPR